MTRPIDIACPTCKVLPGRFCQNPYGHPDGKAFVTLDYHHAARVDAAMAHYAAWAKGWFAEKIDLEQAADKRGDPPVRVFGFPGTVTREQADALNARERAARAEPSGSGVNPDELRAALAEALDMLTAVDEATTVLPSRQVKRIAELRKLVKA